MELTALVIAIVSLIIACISAGWQVGEFLLTGGRPATLMHGLVGPRGAYVGSVDRDGKPKDLRSIYSQGLAHQEVLGVEVTNFGRSQVTVKGYELHLDGGKLTLRPHADALGPDLPFRLQPGESETWYVSMDDVRRLVDSCREVLNDRPKGAYLRVVLGTGRTVETKTRLKV